MFKGDDVQQKRDSEIEQWVLLELDLETDIGSKEICVFCLDGIATLTGTVQASKNALAAGRAAQRANGVLSVVNKITVAPGVPRMPDHLIHALMAPPKPFPQPEL